MPSNLSYTTTTLAQARYQLSLRLLDPNNVYWSVAELNTLIVNSLRTTQALTSFYRQFATFTLSPNVPFYDLTTVTFNGLSAGDNPFGYSVHDTDVIPQIERFLLEPPAIPYTGTSQFTLDQITQAVQSRINQFLLDTGCVVSWPVYVNVTAQISRVQLQDLVLAVRRAAYADSTQYPFTSPLTPLWRQDEFSANSFSVGWQQNPVPVPSSYSISSTPPETLQLIPPPANDGQVSLLTVQAGPSLNPITGSTLLKIPDDFSPYIVWGALADLLSADGQSRDFTRANYCRQRYSEGVAVALTFPAVLNGYINGVQVPSPGSVSEWDAYTPNWQNITGLPSAISLGGRNLVAVSVVPDNAYPYSCGLDLVRNMAVPVLDSDYLQIPRDMLDPLMDYAQHLAAFKMCGLEFANTIPLYQSWLRACARWNSRLSAMTFYRIAMEQPALRQSAEMELTTQSASGIDAASNSNANSGNGVYPTVTT